jgi:hypothetical protein
MLKRSQEPGAGPPGKSSGERDQVDAYCRARSAEDGVRWIPVQREDGSWAAARTNLPLEGTPSGETVEAKPSPPTGHDPRPDVPPWAAGGG